MRGPLRQRGGWLQVEEALLTDNPDDTLATGAWMLRLLCSSAACLVHIIRLTIGVRYR
jgi:hypothetical protein